MTKKQTIKSLLVLPLIASAILLSNPVFAASPDYTAHSEVRHKTSGSPTSDLVGTVTSINGSIVIVTTADGTQYTVDASQATIMQSSGQEDVNPSIVTTSDIEVGSVIVVRGKISAQELDNFN